MPASSMAISIQDATPRPSSRGIVMWYASVVMAPPRYSQMMLAQAVCCPNAVAVGMFGGDRAGQKGMGGAEPHWEVGGVDPSAPKDLEIIRKYNKGISGVPGQPRAEETLQK